MGHPPGGSQIQLVVGTVIPHAGYMFSSGETPRERYQEEDRKRRIRRRIRQRIVYGATLPPGKIDWFEVNILTKRIVMKRLAECIFAPAPWVR